LLCDARYVLLSGHALRPDSLAAGKYMTAVSAIRAGSQRGFTPLGNDQRARVPWRVLAIKPLSSPRTIPHKDEPFGL
jgi:hypothetical protein